jgi:hypothetical protein
MLPEKTCHETDDELRTFHRHSIKGNGQLLFKINWPRRSGPQKVQPFSGFESAGRFGQRLDGTLAVPARIKETLSPDCLPGQTLKAVPLRNPPNLIAAGRYVGHSLFRDILRDVKYCAAQIRGFNYFNLYSETFERRWSFSDSTTEFAGAKENCRLLESFELRIEILFCARLAVKGVSLPGAVEAHQFCMDGDARLKIGRSSG